MCEIKFRAWDAVSKEMFFPSSISWKNGMMWVCGVHGANKFEYEIIHPVDSLMQYTGLKDKNGKEIYEGDFISTPTGFQGTVEWSDLDAGWKLRYKNGAKEVLDWLCLFARPEVVGNIHENPELLPRPSKRQEAKG